MGDTSWRSCARLPLQLPCLPKATCCQERLLRMEARRCQPAPCSPSTNGFLRTGRCPRSCYAPKGIEWAKELLSPLLEQPALYQHSHTQGYSYPEGQIKKNIEDSMQLVKTGVACPLFDTGIRRQSHFTIYIPM